MLHDVPLVLAGLQWCRIRLQWEELHGQKEAGAAHGATRSYHARYTLNQACKVSSTVGVSSSVRRLVLARYTGSGTTQETSAATVPPPGRSVCEQAYLHVFPQPPRSHPYVRLPQYDPVCSAAVRISIRYSSSAAPSSATLMS